MPHRVRITVPSEVCSLAVVDAVISQFAANSGLEPEDTAELGSVVREAASFTLTSAYPGDPTGEIEVTLDLADGGVRVDVHDWGRPLAAGGGDLGALPPELASVDSRTDDLRLINLGADGKRISFLKPVVHALPAPLDAHEADPASASRARRDGVAERVAIRDAVPEDSEAIAVLLYENYHLTYGHPDFYRPRWIAQKLADGSLLSTVAVYEGEIVGHHALLQEERSSSAETGVAVVHPAFRGLGIFGHLFDHTLERAAAQRLDAVYGRAVTVHPYSQRSERSHGYREAALMLGSVPGKMTMEGIEDAEPGGRRTASLLAYLLLRPAVREVQLPAVYEDQLRACYRNLDLAVECSPEPSPPPPGLDPITCSVDETRHTGAILVTALGSDPRTALGRAVRHLLEKHVDVIYADLDLRSLEQIDDVIEGLNAIGFFYSGLAPCGPRGHDFLRLQRLNSENVELERIVCDSPFAQALLADVLGDLRRVAL